MKICPPDPNSCPHVAEAAEVAVKKVFAILGVDVDKPEMVEDFRKDLRFGQGMRRMSDRGFLVATGVIVTAFFSLIGYGAIAFLMTFKGH